MVLNEASCDSAAAEAKVEAEAAAIAKAEAKAAASLPGSFTSIPSPSPNLPGGGTNAMERIT